MISSSVPPYIVLNKKAGQTPLEAIHAWKIEHPEYTDVTATYAGRLDPMASGSLLILLGDECKKRKQYSDLDKEYEIEVVLDLSTDTGDALGLANYSGHETHPEESGAGKLLRTFIGTKTLPYPAFSSKTVHGKPLFQYALEGTLSEISVPTHAETIYSITFLDQRVLSKDGLQKRIRSILAHVPRSDEPSKVLGADFRQDHVRTQWDEVMRTIPERTFTVLRMRVICASGTYMRTLAERIGESLGTRGFALSIHRTKIGTYQKFGSFGFWRKRYS